MSAERRIRRVRANSDVIDEVEHSERAWTIISLRDDGRRDSKCPCPIAVFSTRPCGPAWQHEAQSLSGLKKTYIKLAFFSVDDLMRVKRELLPKRTRPYRINVRVSIDLKIFVGSWYRIAGPGLAAEFEGLFTVFNEPDELKTLCARRVETEAGVPLSDCLNFADICSDISKLKLDLRDNPIRVEKPIIYHLDVGAMYPNIILTNRLQPSAIRTATYCSGENSFLRRHGSPPFRDRQLRYKFKRSVQGDAGEVKRCNGMLVLYDSSLQLAHKCILNFFLWLH
uniref:DNA polymerase epsilon catalytic subunit n=1 Tax=Macrostomum lignano TaxID=282301 RepID=A0A1I8F5T3_9PLAT